MLNSIFKSIAKYCFIIVLPLLLLSCGDDSASTGSLKASGKMPVAKKAAKVKKEAALKKAAQEAAAKSLKPRSSKSTGSLRNPFQSYIMQEDVSDSRVLGPLECCELNLFRLMAVISGIDRPRALIMAPDGQKYITKKGDLMGLRGGKITRIYKNKIVIEEKFKEPGGKKMIKELVELKLPSEDKSKR